MKNDNQQKCDRKNEQNTRIFQNPQTGESSSHSFHSFAKKAIVTATLLQREMHLLRWTNEWEITQNETNGESQKIVVVLFHRYCLLVFIIFFFFIFFLLCLVRCSVKLKSDCLVTMREHLPLVRNIIFVSFVYSQAKEEDDDRNLRTKYHEMKWNDKQWLKQWRKKRERE